MIHIFYRHTTNHLLKNRPEWFDFDKSLDNIFRTIEGKDVKFHMMFDGEWDDEKYKKYPIDDLRVFKGGSDQESFRYTYKYACDIESDDKDLFYFLENDYLHVGDWVSKVEEFYKYYNFEGYVSLYDHLDKYTGLYPDLVSKIILTPNQHWRTTPSTCGTFIVNKKVLLQDKDIHTVVNGDHNKFIQLAQERGRVILTPIPGICTHCHAGVESPIINWDVISEIPYKG
jgi:hypothetical protein